MHVHLSYGRSGLDIALPAEADVTVLEPTFVPGLPDPAGPLRRALQSPIGTPPLRELVPASATVAITFSDGTRPQPRRVMLEALLAEIRHVPPEQIILFNGLGTHRPNTAAELRAMLGDEIAARYPLVQHDCRDRASLTNLGESSRGTPVWLNRMFCEADVRIVTGLVEPHFFAGFSGGPKGIVPGLAGLVTIMGNHAGELLAAPTTMWGVTYGNPLWEELLEIAQLARPTFLFNVALNRVSQISGIFAGEMAAAHEVGADFVHQGVMIPVSEPFDVVLTSNSGYPLDQNLYQAVKGMSAAAQVVREGGAILVAAECSDGLPDHGGYGPLLASGASPAEIYDRVSAPAFRAPDAWQVMIQARTQLRAQVHVYADELTDVQIRGALLTPCRDIAATLRDLVRRFGPRLAVLPEGPMTIPYLAQQPT